jgi:hypothetical protein
MGASFKNHLNGYRYAQSKISFRYFLLFGCLVICLSCGVLAQRLADKAALIGNPLGIQFVCVLGIAGCSFGLREIYRNSRPIVINPDSICAVQWNGQSRCILWYKATKIEKVLYSDSLESRERSHFAVFDQNGSIRFSDDIIEISDLVSRINDCAKKHGISIYARNVRRSATQAANGAEHWSDRLRITNRGVVTRINEL